MGKYGASAVGDAASSAGKSRSFADEIADGAASHKASRDVNWEPSGAAPKVSTVPDSPPLAGSVPPAPTMKFDANGKVDPKGKFDIEGKEIPTWGSRAKGALGTAAKVGAGAAVLGAGGMMLMGGSGSAGAGGAGGAYGTGGVGGMDPITQGQAVTAGLQAQTMGLSGFMSVQGPAAQSFGGGATGMGMGMGGALASPAGHLGGVGMGGVGMGGPFPGG